MTIRLISLIAAFLLNFSLGVIVYKQAPKNLSRSILILFLIGVSLIPLGYIMMSFHSPTLFIHLSVLGALIAITTCLHFSQIFPDKNTETLNKKHFIIYWPMIFIFLVRYSNVIVNENGITRDANFWLGPFAAVMFIYFILAITYITFKYINASGMSKKQLQMILIGIIAGPVLTLIPNMIMPIFFHNSQFAVLGPVLLSILPISLTVSILKHKFMDISVLIKKGIVFSILITIISLIYVIALSSFIDTTDHINQFKIIALSTVIIFGLPQLRKFIEDITDSIFYRKYVNYDKETKAISLGTLDFIEKEDLINYILESINSRFKITGCCITINEDITTRHYITKENSNIRVETLHIPDIFNYFAKYKTPYLLTHEIPETSDLKTDDKEIVKLIRENNIEIIYPFYFENHVIGTLCLSEKLSGDITYQNEIESFLALATQVSLILGKITIQKQLIEAEKKATIGEITKRLVHEIKNPLTSISAFFQFSEMDFSQEEYRDLKEHASKAISRILSLISDLSSYNKLTPKNFEIKDVNEVINSQLHLIKLQCNQKNVCYAFDAGKIPELWIDISSIERAILNILQNAIEAMPEGGDIYINTKKNINHVDINITDTGTGIPESILSQILKPLVTTKKNGSGLGLSITNNIIKSHDGMLKINSGQDKGTTFTIKIPIPA